MEIIQIKQKKNELCDSIGKMIAEFEKETRTQIDGIEIDRVPMVKVGEPFHEIIDSIKINDYIP